MQKRYNIKWRKSDENELAKAARKFNAKRTRILKKNPKMEEYLPPKISTKKMRDEIKTRRDFKNVLNSVERFMRKGSEKPIITKEGVKTTAYEKKEIEIKIRAINARRTAERKRANVSTEKGTMGTIRENNLRPKQVDINKVKKSDWEKFKESVEKQSRDSYFQDKYERYKENLLKGLENAFGEKGRIIQEIAKQIPAEQLTQMYYDDPILQIDFIYDPLEMDVKIEAMTEHLKKYFEP